MPRGAHDPRDLIRDRVSLYELVSRYVSLKRSGRRWTGLCPFHAEDTPSFTVDDERGLFHCFGCKEGGDVFTFLMKIERIGFPEALEELARQAGVELPRPSGGGAGRDERQRLLAVNDAALRFFRERLQSAAGARARAYLERRGLPAAIVEAYALGYAPDGGGALRAHLGHEPALLDAALHVGLLGRNDSGRLYDRFRDRVMFPIRDRAGKVIGFGGRALGEGTPKYLNSPESPLFRKGRTLYGLAEARREIAGQDVAILVEGYMDVLALAAAGIRNAVAALGTAVTADHLRVLRRLTPNVVAFFDGDEAGRAAAERAFAVCAEAGVWARAAFLPQGHDPDSFVRENGVEAVRRLLAEAGSLADFFLDRLCGGPDAPLPARARAAEEVARILARVQSPIERDLLARHAAQRLGVGEEVLRRESARTPRGAPRPEAAAADAAPVAPAAWPSAERLLVEVMALDPQAALWVEERGAVRWFETPVLADAARVLADAARAGEGAEGVLHRLAEPVRRRLAQILLDREAILGPDRIQMARDCVARLEERARRKLLRRAAQELRRAESSGDEERSRAVLSSMNELLRRGGDGT